ncbi:MAG TPA: hypothetical protein DEP69_06560, partial [Acidimicrobiaceae bacterium]|nr:hypothetical protein [Acidimicrobiaceae bacterium]
MATLLAASVLTLVAAPSASAQQIDLTGRSFIERPYAGEDRYETALLIAREFIDNVNAADRADTVILTSGTWLTHPLLAVSLSRQENAPILLTRQNALPPGTAEFLVDNRIAFVVVVGGPEYVSESVVGELDAIASVRSTTRIGVSRTDAEIAVDVARSAGRPGNWCGTAEPTAFLVNTTALPDATTVGPMAFALGLPILLTGLDAVPPATSAYLAEAGIARVVIAGDTDVVSAAVPPALAALGVRVDRLGGVDRFETSLLVLLAHIACHGRGLDFDWEFLALVNGRSLVDGLAAGPLLGQGLGTDGTTGVLLTDRTGLSVAIRDFLADLPGPGPVIVPFGGTDAVPDDVVIGVGPPLARPVDPPFLAADPRPRISGDRDPEITEHNLPIGTYTVTGTGDVFTWEVDDGAGDGPLFVITDGLLRFRSEPDYESPGDDDGDNVYEVVITVTDDDTPPRTSFDFGVTVTVVDTPDPCHVEINGAAPGSSAPAVVGVELHATFSTDAAHNRECPDPGEHDWRWESNPDPGSRPWTLIPTAGDGPTYTPTNDDVGDVVRAVVVYTLPDSKPEHPSLPTAAVPNPPPTIDGDNDVSVLEHTVTVATYTPVDDGVAAGDAFRWTVSGGTDAGLFRISAGGELSFRAGPDFEDPRANVYGVVITVTDAGSPPRTSEGFAVAVTVVDTSLPCTVNISNLAPQVGTVLHARPLGSECPEPGEWRWESTRDPDNPAWTPTATPGGPTYMPTNDDVGDVLRVVLHNVP